MSKYSPPWIWQIQKEKQAQVIPYGKWSAEAGNCESCKTRKKIQEINI